MLVASCLNKVSCIIMSLYKIYAIVFYFRTLSKCIFNALKKQSGIELLVDTLFGYFEYLHSLYTRVELHTNFVLINFEMQPYCYVLFILLHKWKRSNTISHENNIRKLH